MRKTIVALGAAALLTGGQATADPISVSVYGESSGTISDFTSVGRNIDVSLDWTASDPLLLSFDLQYGRNYTISLALPSGSWSDITVEILNADPGRDNLNDPAEQPSYVPGGWSTSNNDDGISFAERANIERSLIVGNTSFALFADERTNARDLLSFSGLASGPAMLTFGLRSYNMGGAFLVRLAGTATDVVSPEPASMLLIGAGLIGTAGAIRRRRRSKTAAH